MGKQRSISAPYHVAFSGSLLSIAESASDFLFYDYWIESAPVEISREFFLATSGFGMLIAFGIAGALYYLHRHEDLKKDHFLYVIIAALIGLLIGGQIANIITLVGAIACYKRFE